MKNNPFRISIPLALLAILFAGDVVAGSNLKQMLFSKTVAFYNDTVRLQFISNRQVFEQGWDTMAQARFWQQII